MCTGVSSCSHPYSGSVTVIFVVGYSWVDTHLPVLANSGWGVDLAWKRAQVLVASLRALPNSFLHSLLVLIGFTAAFIISLFPRPQSAKKTVRRILAKSIDNSSELFMEEIKGFLLKACAHDNPTACDADLDAKLSPFRARFLGLAVGYASSPNSSTSCIFRV
jgi:hypothetical protein